MISKVIFVLVLTTIGIIAQTPPIWGGNLQYSVNVTLINNKPIMTWNFTYYYNWNLKAQRYEHQAPQADEMCLFAHPPFTINDSCTVTFATDGWSYIQYPKHNWCCKCQDKFGAIRSDWLKQNSTYAGITQIDGRSVTHWTKMGLYLNNYYSTVDKALPVRFNQTKNGNLKQWDFDLKTYNAGPFDPQKLKPKCTKLCGGDCIYFRSKNMQTQ